MLKIAIFFNSNNEFGIVKVTIFNRVRKETEQFCKNLENMMNSTSYLSKLARGKSERRGSLIQIVYDENVQFYLTFKPLKN